MTRRAWELAIVAALGFVGAARSAPIVLVYDSFEEAKVLQTPVDPTTSVLLNGRINRSAGPPTDLTQNLAFTAGSASLGLSASWRIGPNPPSSLLGVNIDLRDNLSSVLASDVFQGVSGEVATSQFLFSGLTAGRQYEIQLTGSPVGNALYGISITGASAIPSTPAVPQVVPPADRALFDTLSGSKRSFSVDPGEALRIDGSIVEAGAVSNETVLSVTSGTVSADIAWLVQNTPTGLSGLIGVNVDLLETTFGTLIASDTFLGVANGQASSRFVATGLASGDYVLRLTGVSTGGAMYRIDVGTGATPIPEPTSWAVLVIALLGLVSVAQRRRPAGASLTLRTLSRAGSGCTVG